MKLGIIMGGLMGWLGTSLVSGADLIGSPPCTLSITPLTNQVHCLCGMVAFSTEASGTGPFYYAWKFGERSMPNETNATLVLHNLKPSDAGAYTVQVSNACQTVTSSATLTLIGSGDVNPVVFSNTNPIVILDNQPAIPYPSRISVCCIPGLIKNVSVTLHGLSHRYPDDIDMALVSPSGWALKLMSDAGGSTPLDGVNLTFTDSAMGPLPNEDAIVSGTYQPTDYEQPDFLPYPASGDQWAPNFAGFQGTEPNGDWSLCIADDYGGDGGTLDGWSLQIEWQDTPCSLSSPRILSDGRFQMILHGAPGLSYTILTSTDLNIWEPMSGVYLTGPTATITDLESKKYPSRFYRATRCF